MWRNQTWGWYAFGAMKPRAYVASACLLTAVLTICPTPFAQQADPALASQPARPSPEWLKAGAIYQIFVRSFSPSGDLNGVTAKLEDLHALNAGNWKEIELPTSKPDVVAIPFVSLKAFGACIFQKQSR